MKWPSIPQMFSNLIGEVLPGLVVLILFVATILGPKGALDALFDANIQRRVFSIGPLLTVLALSQAVGILLGQFWSSLLGRALQKAEARIEREHLGRRLAVHNHTLVALQLAPLSLSLGDLPDPSVMYDHLHLSAPDQAARLLKVRAERRNCHVLALGAVLLAALNLWLTVQALTPERIGWEVALLCTAVASVLRARRLVGFRANGIATTWLSLASAQRLPFQSRTRHAR
jgi:hypothetical protein